MSFDPDRHHRRSIRLPEYDYSLPGCYFVTICSYQRLHLFDNPALRTIAEAAWMALPGFDPCLRLDAWVLMPNHVHGIIEFVERSSRARPTVESTQRPAQVTVRRRPVAPGTLSAVVRSFKAVVTRRAHGLGRLSLGPIWQRGFWERIIRDEDELQAVRRYIEDNPRRWSEGRDNLDALLSRMQLE